MHAVTWLPPSRLQAGQVREAAEVPELQTQGRHPPSLIEGVFRRKRFLPHAEAGRGRLGGSPETYPIMQTWNWGWAGAKHQSRMVPIRWLLSPPASWSPSSRSFLCPSAQAPPPIRISLSFQYSPPNKDAQKGTNT